MKKWLLLLLTLVLLGSLWLLPGMAAANSTAVNFSTDGLFLAVGQSTTVRASATPYVAKKQGVTFTISDETVATVTDKGKVTAVGVGECQVTATSVYDPSVSASIPVRVVVPVEDLVVDTDTDTVAVGQTLSLGVACLPENATVHEVNYTSSRDSIATVNADGVVTGVARGKVTISMTSADGFASASYTVYVQQLPESLDITPESVAGPAGRKTTLKTTVLPAGANDKSLSWASADESIATVSDKGVVTIVGVGETTVTATCNGNPAITATVPVQGMELAQSIAFDSTLYSVQAGQTTQLYVTVQPDGTTDKSVTYAVKDKRIATVDENGVVTGVKGGKTTVYAYTADGSKKRAAATIQVVVPVTGVSYKYKDVRVSAGGYASYTVEVLPKNATDKAMTWVSSDTGIATVSGTTNRFKVTGRRWGRCKVTGTTVDGGFTVDIYVDVGSLRHAVTIISAEIRNGKPYITLKNRSNMNITQVRFQMYGYDDSLQPITMSYTDDPTVLLGSYDVPLAEGDKTTHGRFTFYHPSDYAGLSILQFTITGWTTDTGYYDHNGKLQYNYNISQDKWEWVTYPAGVNPLSR